MAFLTKVNYNDAMYFCMLINRATSFYNNFSTFINVSTRIRMVLIKWWPFIVPIRVAPKGSIQITVSGSNFGIFQLSLKP